MLNLDKVPNFPLPTRGGGFFALTLTHMRSVWERYFSTLGVEGDNVSNINFWLIIGFVAQGLFFLRFFVQWIASERQGKSVVPLAFWIFSILGGSMLLIYAIYRKDPVFIFGQAGGLVIYTRNLMLIYKERKRVKVYNKSL